MGILDDAIRAHLELKRSRGADPQEIKLQEREVFGAQPEEAAAQEPQQVHETAESVENLSAPQSSSQQPPVSTGDPLAPNTTQQPADFLEATQAHNAVSQTPPAEQREEHVDQPTAAYSAQELADALGQDKEETPEAVKKPTKKQEDQAAQDEDVLSETPEFLSQAPEHDRLWFEQRPPRDFDFEG